MFKLDTHYEIVYPTSVSRLKNFTYGAMSLIILAVALPLCAADAENLKSQEMWLDNPAAAKMTLNANSAVRDNKKALKCFQDRMNEFDRSLRSTKGLDLFVLNANAIAMLNGKETIVIAEYTSASQFYHKGDMNYKKHEQWMIGKYQVTVSKALINITCK